MFFFSSVEQRFHANSYCAAKFKSAPIIAVSFAISRFFFFFSRSAQFIIKVVWFFFSGFAHTSGRQITDHSILLAVIFQRLSIIHIFRTNHGSPMTQKQFSIPN